MPLPPSLKRKRLFQHTAARRRLGPTVQQGVNTVEFQHTAARRRLAADSNCRCASDFVSTHSRPKAAGGYSLLSGLGSSVSTHSRPKAAGRNQPAGRWVCMVSTHSRPKAAGASLKSLAPSGFAALISLSSQEKREREYNTAFSVTPEFAIS